MPASGLRFAPESLQNLRIVGNFIRQEPQSNKSVQAGVFGFVYGSMNSKCRMQKEMRLTGQAHNPAIPLDLSCAA